MADFFSYHRTWQTSGNNFSGYTRFFDKYCASHMIICLGPKKSITIFFKTMFIVPKKKIFCQFFSCYPLRQIWNNLLLVSTSYFGFSAARYKIISLLPKSLFKTQFFEKTAIFPVKKLIILICLVISNMTNVKENLIRVHKVFWHLLWKS